MLPAISCCKRVTQIQWWPTTAKGEGNTIKGVLYLLMTEDLRFATVALRDYLSRAQQRARAGVEAGAAAYYPKQLFHRSLVQ
jgi:hypothetical protein